ncbi:uncharacterized protein LOC135135765 [Zophobas morio]|uniref:uncharacterized protein LOC135135765 n=1 Tax=Zophobas morio TaxID=2755281 RepID=UPI0030833689
MKEEMGARMEKMDARGEQINAKMKKMNEKMDEKMEARNKEMDEKMDGRMEKTDEKIDKQKHAIITSLSEKFQMEVEANQNEITGIKEQMKDIQTNLKVVENFVGENVVLMDEKVKEEIEHQLKTDFLGLCTYYRRFVNGFADIAAPLHRLMDLKSQFNSAAECEAAFKRLKNALCSSPILSYPQSSGMFILDTDASNIGIGAVLSQVQDKEEKVIEYFSGILLKTENYCATRKELLAIVRAVEHFHKYLYGREFLIRTDYAALIWLFQMKNPERQDGFNDSNSITSKFDTGLNCKHCDKIEQRETSFNCGRTAVTEDEEWTTAQLRKDQEEDVDIRPLLKWKEVGAERPAWSEISNESPSFKALWAQWDSLRIENFPSILSILHILPAYALLFLPPSNISYTFLFFLHDLIHKGNCLVVPRSLEKNMLDIIHRDIENKVMSCEACQKYCRNNFREPLISPTVPKFPWQKIGCDLYELRKEKFIIYYS